MDDGRTVEVTPTSFFPLSFQELVGVSEEPNTPIAMELRGTEAVLDGVPQNGQLRAKMKITFERSPAPYALVLGGWLPLYFVTPQHFLVDRNVVSTIRSIRANGPRQHHQNFAWWTQLLESGTALFNPLLYAYEGSERRTPRFDEFVLAFRLGAAELRAVFPHARIIEYGAEHFHAAYCQLEALSERSARDSQFLVKALSLVHNRVPLGREEPVLDQVLECATHLGVSRKAPVVLAVLSILYEDVHGSLPCIGRKLLKPRQSYSPEDAFNAVNDLRHIEIAALSHAILPEQAFALCTNDRAIAMFWCALEFRGKAATESLMNLEYAVGKDLWPRLDDGAISQVMKALDE
ncbi:MAG: hypothetical protein ACOYBO_04135 [Azonexus sp.]